MAGVIDGIYNLEKKGVTPVAINEIVKQVLEKEKQFFPKPQSGQTLPLQVDRYRREFVQPAPTTRHPDAVYAQLVKGCNSPRHLRDLTYLARQDSRNLGATLARDKRFQASGRLQEGRTCGFSTKDFFHKSTNVQEEAMVLLEQEVLEKIDENKQGISAKVVIPPTSAGMIGLYARNPYDRKWKRTDLPGNRRQKRSTWRYPYEECEMVEYGRKFYEDMGVNCFSAKAKTSLFSGKPS